MGSVARRGQLLQRRLGMLGRAALLVDQRLPQPADERLGGVEAGVEEQGADQRLDDVADDIVALVGAVVARLLAEPDERRKPDLAADLGAGLARRPAR